MRVAVLEDDQPLSDLIVAVLESAGHTAHVFHDCRSIKVALRQDSFDLLLLDWHLPDSEGVEVLTWARQHCEPCPPVIMVTSRSKDSDIVAALEAGADDYITKPIAPSVMLARVSALLRRTYQASAVAQEREVHCGVTFDHADCAVEIGGRREILTAKEFRLALLMFQNIDRPMSQAHLLESVWGRNPDLLTRTLDVHISRLRARLGLRPGSGFKLSPVHSFGYRLEAVAGHPQDGQS